MARPVITEPCIHPDIDEDWYHADPVTGGSLSVSGAKLLLQAPAKFDYARRNGSKSTKSMDLGTRVHAIVLGKGEEHLELLPYEEYRTGEAKAARDAAIASGKIPTKPREWEEAQEIAAAVLAHPTTGGLFTDGDAEVSMFAKDPEFGIWLRGRADYMTYFDGLPTIVDFKTTADASPEEFGKSAYKFGYHRQDPWYRELWASFLGCDWQDVDFVFAVVETEAPYCVATYHVKPEHVGLGREQNRIARERFRDCQKADVWPGYSEEIEDLELPRYGVQQIEKEINDWYR
ncbi:MAG TPA: PD-(D/E)XK nuclease-like domain-containing protein [Actinospica sp.]|nr:PD-(D/E)XK nuclease-like domain-containing protein [Actinospica sp.]